MNAYSFVSMFTHFFHPFFKRHFIKRLTIIGNIVFLALLVFAPTESQAQKLKNVSGNIQISGKSFPIDSVIHELPIGTKKEVFDVFYNNNGALSNQLFQLPSFPLGGSVPWSGGSFATNDKHDGNGGVLCTFGSSPGPSSISGSFSYSRFMPHLVRAIPRDSILTNYSALHSLSNPPDYLKSLAITFHLYMDGKVDDNDSAAFRQGQNFYYKRVLTDTKGKQVDSTQFLYAAHDTIESVYGITTWGRYTDKISFVGDTLVFVPDSTMTLRYIINPGIYQSTCLGLPWLSFDASYTNVSDTTESPTQEGKGWQDGYGIGIIHDSGTVFINGGLLRFHGIMNIDTVNNLIDANGEFYIFTQLPFTQKPGPWKLGTANWPRFTYSCKGLVPLIPIINDAISSDSIGGFTFRIDSIYFFTDSTGVSGVRLGATVRIPGVTYETICGGSNGSYGNTSSDIFIAPFEITSNGIGGALHISNVSIFPFFCVKDLFGSYYSKPDSLSFGAEFKTPFLDKLALSAGWKQGIWDAVSFNVQAAAPGGIPIANTTMQLTGVRGSASGWNNPPLKFSMGGTFDDVVPNTMEWEGDLSYQEPSTLKGSLTLKFINAPGIGWQLINTASAEVDWDHYVKFSGSGQAGTLGNGYVFNGSQSLTFTWNPEVDLIGTLNGSLSIPKLFKAGLSPITDYFNSLLPLQLGSVEMLLKSGIFKGNFTINYIPLVTLSAHVAVDLHLPFSDPNFINFGLGTIPLSIAHRSAKAQIASLTLDSIHVPTNTAFAVIRIRSNGLPSVSTVIDPSNSMHSNLATDSLAQYSIDAGTRHGFWVLRNPAAGIWKLSMPARTATDTIDAQAEPMEEPLQFTAIQIGKHVTLNWTPLSGSDNADVTAYLDDSSSGYKGFLIAIASDKAGTLSFDLNDSLPECQYYLYAARDNRAYISRSYSSITLDNSKTSALAPMNPTTQHLGGDTILLRWTPTTSAGSLAYAIKVTDANSMDSTYGSAYPSADSAIIIVKNPQGKRISLDAYGNGIQSCWSQSVSAVSSVPKTNDVFAQATLDLQVWPNPTNGKCELSFTLAERNMVRVTIFDILGREITTPVQAVLEAGKHTSTCDLSSLSPGTYYCRIQSAGTVESAKLVIER